MQKTIFLALLILGLFFFTSLPAQHSHFQHLEIAQGLPSSVVYAIHQDHQGYLWLGTDAGLCRYDGESFQVFTAQDGLPDNEILGFFEDSQHRIWMYTYNGRPGFWDQGTFHNPENTPWLKDCSALFFTTLIWEDSKGEIYVCNGDLYQLGATHPAHRVSPSDNKITKIFAIKEDPTGAKIAINVNGIHQIHLDESVQTVGKVPLKTYRGAAKYAPRPNGDYFLFSEQTIFNWDGENYPPIPWEVKGNIISVYEDPSQQLWVGTYQGVYVLNSDYQVRDSLLLGSTVSGTLMDNEGNLWFTTLGEGVYVTSIQEAKSWGQSEGVEGIYCIAQGPDSAIWLGGNNSRLYRQKGTQFTPISLPKIAYSVHEKRILKLMLGKHGDFFATGDAGLFHLQEGKWEAYSLTSLKDIALDKNGNLYFSNNHGVWEFNSLIRGLSQKMASVPKVLDLLGTAETNPYMIVAGRPNAMVMDKKGRIYSGHKNGLWISEVQEPGDWISKADSAFSRMEILDLAWDDSDNLWGAALGKGIFCKTQDSLFWPQSQALRSQGQAHHIFIESPTEIWTATKIGLGRLHKVKGKWEYRLFGEREGMLSSEVRDVLVKKDTVWVASAKGLTAIPKNRLTTTEKAPTLRLTRIFVQENWIPPTAGLELLYRDNRVRIQYEALSYSTGGALEYRYKMKGLEEEWSHSNGKEAQYNSLPPGAYTFMVQARRGTGPWSGRATLPLEIKKPWWQKVWIWAIIAGLYVVGVWLIFRFRIRRLEEKAKLEQSVLISEQKALRAQMNPHFIFNALNAVQQFFLNQQLKEGNLFLNKFSRLIRKILENSDQLYLSLEEELEMIRPYIEFEQLRSGGQFQFEIKLAEGLDPYNTLIPGMLIQPLLENAIWHGIRHRETPGLISLEVTPSPNGLSLCIRDNGVGRKAAAQFESSTRKSHRSMGLKLIQDRIEVINSLGKETLKLYLSDLRDPDGGTIGTQAKITLELPSYA